MKCNRRFKVKRTEKHEANKYVTPKFGCRELSLTQTGDCVHALKCALKSCAHLVSSQVRDLKNILVLHGSYQLSESMNETEVVTEDKTA